jgi:adenylate cyclase
MEGSAKQLIRIDLSQFKLHISLKSKTELTLHFDSPSRRFYLSVIALVVNEMKRLGKITSIPLENYTAQLILLNETIGSSAGSSEKENLIPRIYRKWKDALPDLENAPLFKVVGRKKEQEDEAGRIYRFSEVEKDLWANLFEYKGSEEHVRLRFSIDKLGAGLDDTAIVYEDSRDSEAWERFISSLETKPESDPTPGHAGKILEKPETLPQSPVKLKAKWLKEHRWAVFVAALFFAAGASSLAIWQAWLPGQAQDRASPEKMAFPLPDKPSIAVLPFVNMSEDHKQEYIADGITEEIITALAKIESVFVIARNSTFVYKGKPVKVQQIAEELGVRYVMEGSIRKTGDQVRITVQLIDALNGHHMWAERYDRPFKDLLAMQDDVIMKILTSLRVKLTEGENARAFAKGTKNLEAYLKILQAYEQRLIFNKQGQARARQLVEEAIALDPGYALAYSQLAVSLGNEVALGVHGNPKEVVGEAYKIAEKAVSLDDSSAWAHVVFGIVNITHKRDYDKAIVEAERAVALEPGSAYPYGQLASFLTWSGRYGDAIPYYRKAFRLSPRPMPIWLFSMAAGYIAMGQYEEAIKILKGIAEKQPDQLFAHTALVSAYMLSGRENEAKREAAEVLRIDPGFSVDRMFDNLPFKDQSEMNRRKEALRKAGLR